MSEHLPTDPAAVAALGRPDVYAAVEDVLAKHCRGFMDRPTTRENIAELVDRICATYERDVQQRQLLQRQLDAVDREVGFPHDDGKGRIELIRELKAPALGTLEALVKQTEARIQQYEKSYLLRSQAERDHADSEYQYYVDVRAALARLRGEK